MHVQVIADFDMTLTKYLVDGVRGQSMCNLQKKSVEVQSLN